jgi:hypothetical protein
MTVTRAMTPTKRLAYGHAISTVTVPGSMERLVETRREALLLKTLVVEKAC